MPKRSSVHPAPPLATEPDEEVIDFGYSIRVASRLTGIGPDTLRIWERRYGFPKPKRTPGGSRVYSAGDIQLLQLIARALKQGFRPGAVVGHAREELERLVASAPVPADLPKPKHEGAPDHAALLSHLAADKASAVREAIRQAALLLGPLRFLVEFAQPLTRMVGQWWEAGKLEIHQEHLFSECLSSQLHLMLSAYPEAQQGPVVLLATLSGESHTLGLEMIALYLALQQVIPRMIGANTPQEQIVRAARSHAADVVGISITPSSDSVRSAQALRWIHAELPRRVQIWIGGDGARDLDLKLPQLKRVVEWSDLDQALAELKTSRA